MARVRVGLRGKMFLGGVAMLFPLVVTLASLTNAYQDQWNTARKELAGRDATRPLMVLLGAWDQGGPEAKSPARAQEALDAYHEVMATHEAELGKPWEGRNSPDEMILKGPAGNSADFLTVTRTITGEIGRIADASGLVLDPDLQSYYLMLTLFQAIPLVLDQTAQLELLTSQSTEERSNFGVDLGIAATRIQDYGQQMKLWMTLSDQANRNAPKPVLGFDTFLAQMDALGLAATTLSRYAIEVAHGAKTWTDTDFGPSLRSILSTSNALIPIGMDALGTMIQDRMNSLQTRLVVAWALTALGLGLSSFLFFLLGTSVRARSRALVQSLSLLAEGDLRQAVPSKLTQTRDELGSLALSVQVLRDDMGAAVHGIAEASAKLGVVGSSLAATAEQAASAVEEMTATSGQVARIARQQTQETTKALEEVDELTSRVSESNELTQGMATQFFLFSQAMEANRRRVQATAEEANVTQKLVIDLDATGERGQASLESLRHSIGSVAELTKQIEEIVQFILDISDRTNLLSMNASIEAAHAGTLGRGFKVVADEIRKLAETSGTQAKAIRELVETIAGAAQTTLEKAATTGEAFEKVREDIRSVRSASETIAEQINLQEDEDAKLTAGLEEFTKFYGDLSGSMEVQVIQIEALKSVMHELADGSRLIGDSTDEQRLGMDQASQAVVHMRDTSMEVNLVTEHLAELMVRFRVDSTE